MVTRLEDWLSFSGFELLGLVTGGVFVLAVLLFRRGVIVSLLTFDTRRFRIGTTKRSVR